MKHLKPVIRVMPERIKMARKQRGVTAQDLAEACGVSPAAISHDETGKSWALSNVLIAMCRALNVSADFLCGFVPTRERLERSLGEFPHLTRYFVMDALCRAELGDKDPHPVLQANAKRR